MNKVYFLYELGKEAKDKITDYKGVIIGRIDYLYGCKQYGLCPKTLKDGKIVDTLWFDEGRIEIIGDGIKSKEVRVKKNGGINRDCPK